MKTLTTFVSEMSARSGRYTGAYSDVWMPTRDCPKNHISRRIEAACEEIRSVYWERYDTHTELYQNYHRENALALVKSESARRLVERRKWRLPVEESKRLKTLTIKEVAKKHDIKAEALENILGYKCWERREEAYEDIS